MATVVALTQSVSFTASIPSPPRGVWEIGPVPIRAYALCIIGGILIANSWGDRRLVARGGRPGAITDLAVWAVLFGLVGGRLSRVITVPGLYFAPGRNPWNVFAVWDGGLSFWGAIAFGGLGAYIGARRYRIAFGAVADALAPAIVLAQAIGRIGNYFNQEFFGSPTSMPWALDVYLRTPGGVPQPLVSCALYNGEFQAEWIKTDPTVLCGTYHPTFLYELLWDIAVVLLVVWTDRRFRLGHGRAFALYVAGYTAGRGWIEMLRIDHANHILGLRLTVFVAVVVFLAAVIYLIATRHLGREAPSMVRGTAPRRAGRGRGQVATETGGNLPDEDPAPIRDTAATATAAAAAGDAASDDSAAHDSDASAPPHSASVK